MTYLVVYYTRTHKTQQVAEEIAKIEDANLLRIYDKTKRSGAIGYIKGAFDAMRNKDTIIEHDDINIDDYDTIYIGGPVWASKPAPAILKFIKDNDFKGHNIVTFTTMMSSGEDPTLKIMNDEVKSHGGNIIKSFAIKTKNTDINKLTSEALSN